MRVILLEFIDEASLFLKKYGRNFFLSQDTIAICLHPKVRVFLKEKGIDSFDTVDYFDNAAQHRIILKTEETVLSLLQNIELKDNLGLENGYRETCIYHLRFYFNHFLWILEILNGIKKKHPLTEIFCCRPANRLAMYTQGAFIHNDERFLGFLAEDFCAVNNIKFNAVYSRGGKKGFLISSAVKIVRFCARLIALIDYQVFKTRFSSRAKTIVVPATSYNMGNLLNGIRKRNSGAKCVMIWEGKSTFKESIFEIYLILSNYFKRLKKKNVLDAVVCLDLIKNTLGQNHKQRRRFEKEIDRLVASVRPDLDGLLVLDEVSFAPYLAEKIEYGLKEQIVALTHSTRLLGGILRRLKPKLLISMYSVGIYYMMGELSSYLGFSALSLSHGTHVPPNNEYEKIENYRLSTSVIMNTYSYVVVQTPWAEKFLDYYGDRRPRIFSGPLLYSKKSDNEVGRIKKKILGIPEGHKIIMHASTQKARCSLRFHIEETLDEYIASLIDLCVAVEGFETVSLVIRPHPVCDITTQEFLALLPKSNKIIIMNTGPFKDALSIANLLVSYSSTCIEEALQNRIPVVLYDRWKRYNHFCLEETKSAKDIQKRPAYYVTEPEVLKDCLPVLLEVTQSFPLEDKDLTEFKYPQNVRENFYHFIDQTLNKETVN